MQNKFGLMDWHVPFLQILMLPKALRPSRHDIINRFNLTEANYYYWLRHPGLNEARRLLVKQYFIDDVPDVIMAMRNEALSGNERAARLFLEYVDDFQKTPLLPDPNDKPPAIPISEVNIIINNLEQKFYGNSKPREDQRVIDQPST